MAKEWYFQVMGSEIGPVSSAELKQRVQRGQIQADTPVRAAPNGKWQSADRIKGLIDPPAPPPMPPPKATPAAQPMPVASSDTRSTMPLAETGAEERTYHVQGTASVEATSPEVPASGEYDFFQFVGFEQALGPRLHRALLDHCHQQQLTLTEATRRALAAFLNRKDLLEEPSPAPAPDVDIQSAEVT